jgi:hypothetical protein
LDNFPLFEGDSPAHDPEEDYRKGNDSQSSDLKQDQAYDLTREGEVFAQVDTGQARHADCRGGRKQGVDKGKRRFAGGKGEPQKEGPQDDYPGKTEDKDPCRRKQWREQDFQTGQQIHVIYPQP